MELLAPAGNLEKLKTAVRFGADAVYCAAGQYSLRAAGTAFSLNELSDGISFAHQHGCKVYLAMNIFAFDDDLDQMMDYYTGAAAFGVDAVIVSDLGVLYRIRQLGKEPKIHLSTQANTTNSDSVRFWHNQGVQRIVLARELSLSQIKEIKDKVPEVELEILVHGAMCIAYSGRCLLSKTMTDRSANRGDCAQPCRWEYHLRETFRRDRQTICEEGGGTYILNSRDLCMIEHLPQIATAGIDSIKIEGRMKSAYYVAAVTRVYRAALNSLHDPKGYRYQSEWYEELTRVSHRPYTTGFYLPGEEDETEYVADSSYIGGHDFVGIVESYNREGNILTILGRNRFRAGDTLEILDPQKADIQEIKIERIYDQAGESLKEAHNGYTVNIPLMEKISGSISRHSIVRKRRASI